MKHSFSTLQIRHPDRQGRSRLQRACDPEQDEGSRQRGQSLTEFALVMPLLIALLVAVMLFAWIGFSYVTITNAAREGTHWMTNHNTPDPPFATVDQQITWIVTNSMPFLVWQNAVITISPAEEFRTRNTQVSVHVEYPVSLPVIRIPYVVREGEFMLLPPIVLNAESRMRLYWDSQNSD